MSSDVDLRDLAIDRGGSGGTLAPQRRHVLTRYVLPLLLILGFLLLVAWASRDLIFRPKPVTVVPVYATTAEVQKEGTPLFNAAGWIEPRPTPVRVAALASGVVEKLLVVEDQPVKVGDSIALLIRDDAKLNHDGALADLDLRLAELDEVRAELAAAETLYHQPVHLQAALSEADAFLAKTQTQLTNLPFELRRAKSDYTAKRKDYEGKLAAKGVVASVEIDIAEGDVDSARALVEELDGRLVSLTKEQTALAARRDALKIQLDLRADETRAKDEAKAKIKAANARVAQSQVAVAEAKLQLDRMTVVAPVRGRVFQLIAHPGARIGSGMTQMTGHDGSTVVTMYIPSRLQVRVDARFEDIPKVSVNQPVEIDNPALSSPLRGRVLRISSEADIQKNTLQVKVEILDPPLVFKPEMLVDVTFLAPKRLGGPIAPTKELKLYIQRQLVHEGEGRSYVWLADQSSGIAVKSTVQTGAVSSNGLIEIVAGLTVSAKIISGGIEGLKHGDRIEVVAEDASIGTDHPGPSSSNDSSAINRLPAGGN